jgi:hypothetical protein
MCMILFILFIVKFVFHYHGGHFDDSDQHYSDKLDQYEFVMNLTSTLRCTVVEIHEHFKNDYKLKHRIN